MGAFLLVIHAKFGKNAFIESRSKKVEEIMLNVADNIYPVCRTLIHITKFLIKSLSFEINFYCSYQNVKLFS